MQFKKYAFSKLPFSKLFKAYTGDFAQTAAFFKTNPHQLHSVKKRAQSFSFKGNRLSSADLLKNFNSKFKVDDATFANIDRLKQDNSLAIVTGQQLGLYGGPLYTIYKIVTTINLARRWEKNLDRPVIPVFWLADEDHDFDEVKSIQLVAEDEIRSFSLPGKENGLPPVSELPFPDKIRDIRSALQSALIDTDFSEDLWALLDECFIPGNTFLQGFGNYIARLFSRHGLVLAGSDATAIKQHTKDLLICAVKADEKLREALENQSQKIEQKFHQQASVYNSHLFYLHPEKGRLKIHHDEAKWQTNASQQWTRQQLVTEIASNPEHFSPDVFLRPVLQDRLLPTLGYVAGPGEIAYYGQMKLFYRGFDQQMPVIFPRLSATLIEPAIDRIIAELPFDFGAYRNRIEDLESEFVDHTEQTDIESLFEGWKEKTKSIASSPISKIASIDETLEGAAEKTQAVYFNEMDKLKGKVYRSVKKGEEIQLHRIRRIQQNLFPGRNLQERTFGSIYYMNKFGLDIWDRLLDETEEKNMLTMHTLVYL